ncbi:MAG TPA: hypothetical protein VF411_08280 [Bacteroidia bacterium]
MNKYIIPILIMTLDLIINLIGFVPFGKNQILISFSIIILCSIVIAVFAIRGEKKQDLFNRWSIFLITTNIQHEDNLRSKDSTDFRPYKILLKQFTLKEIKELKKNNYFKLNFNIEGYEFVISMLNIYVEFIDKIDFTKFTPAQKSQSYLLDSPKEVNP